jgi:hypothetical protein
MLMRSIAEWNPHLFGVGKPTVDFLTWVENFFGIV